jgi:amidophosphoribosyltransferase
MVVNGETWIQPEWEERIKDVDIKGATSDSAKLAGMIVHDYVQTSNLEKVLYDVYNEIFDYGMIAAAGILVDDRINKQYLFKMVDGGRPFCEAKVDGHLVGVSETNYLQALKLKKQNTVDYINQIGGGTITIQDLQTKKITTSPRMDRIKPKCFFDKHYLQRPDSIWGKRTNASYRRWCGRCLASEHPPLHGKNVAVTAVPQSGISYTHGFCHKSRAMQEEILIRSPLSKDDRSFMISQNKKDRGELALWKLDVSEQDCVGKIVVAVDDSLVEGNMFVKAVFLLRNAGATEVHFRVGCPPIVGPCHSGIYIPAERPLVKQLGLDPKEIVKDQSLLEERLKHISDPEFGELNVDSVGYLSIESLKKCLGKKRYCMGCVTLEYPYKFNGMEKCDAKFVPVKPRKKTEDKSIVKE